MNDNPLKALWYGPSYTGKTVLSASATDDERTSPVLLLDFEKQTRSIRSKCETIDLADIGDKAPPKGKLHHVVISNIDHLDRINDLLLDKPTTFDPYKCIIVDSFTEINYMATSFSVWGNAQPKLKAQKKIEYKDYNFLHGSMKLLVRTLRDWPGHVLYTALPKGDFSEGEGVTPSLGTAALAHQLIALIDIVGYMRIRPDGDREVVFQPDGRFYAKDKSEGNVLGKSVVDPTITKILNLLENE